MTWQPYDGSAYLDFDAVEAWCRALAAAHPEWVSLVNLGLSRHGRELLLLTISRQDTEIGDRPGFWLDGATHASEWTGVMSALWSVSRWVERLVAGDPAERAWFSEHAVYVLPVISADGYAWTHEGGPFVRSTLRPPRDGRPRTGLHPHDVDGDGETLWMRWRHPTGAYVIDPDHIGGFRLRTLDDDPELACHILVEGTFLRWDGAVWKEAAREHGLDLNRNFPGSWQPQSMFGMDAGNHPLSEPESRAVMDAVTARPRIACALTNHTFTGALLTQPYRKDSPLPRTDVRLLELMGKDATKDTGYRVVRVYPDFMYDPERAIGGVWSDTLATVLGVPAYTLELWDAYGYAGVEVEDFGAFFRDPPQDLIDGLLRAFCAEPGGFVDWRPFEHPQLGPVEIGGLRNMLTLGNPPLRLLPAECEKGFTVADRLRRALPKVDVQVTAEHAGDDLVRVVAVAENRGFLPTSGLRYAEGIGVAPPVVLTLQTDGELLDGQKEVDVGWLDGWGSQHAEGGTQRLHPGLASRGPRARVAWLVRGGTTVEVRFDAGRGGAGVARA